MKRIISLIIIAVLCTMTAVSAAAADLSARTVSIFKIEGSVKMTKGTAKEFNAREGLKLYNGYTVKTGKESNAWLNLDDDSLIQMDKATEIKISKASAKKLSVSVLTGSIAVNAAAQDSGDELEVLVGSTSLAVRGTFFIVEYSHGEPVRYTMLEGEALVDGEHLLQAGYSMQAHDDEAAPGQSFTVKKWELDDFSRFVLEIILDNEKLLADVFTAQEFDLMRELLENMPEDIYPDAPGITHLVRYYYDAAGINPAVNGSTGNDSGDSEDDDDEDNKSSGGGGGGGSEDDDDDDYYDEGSSEGDAISGDSSSSSSSTSQPLTVPAGSYTGSDIMAFLAMNPSVMLPSGTSVTVNGELTIGTGQTLTMMPGAAMTVSSGGLAVQGMLNNNGNINLAGSGSNLVLQSGAVINNGDGTGSGAGTIQRTITGPGITVSAGAAVAVNNNESSTMVLETIDNSAGGSLTLVNKNGGVISANMGLQNDNGGTIALSNTGGTISAGIDNRSGSVTISNAGGIIDTGIIINHPGGIMTINNSAGGEIRSQIYNNGQMSINGSLFLNATAAFEVGTAANSSAALTINGTLTANCNIVAGGVPGSNGAGNIIISGTLAGASLGTVLSISATGSITGNTANFYDTANAPVTGTLTDCTFIWDADAGGPGIAGWLLQ